MQELDASLIDLTSSKIRIRALLKTDEDLYLALYTSTAVMKYICEPLSLEKASQSFQYSLRLNSDVSTSRVLLTICSLEDGLPIGLCSVSNFDRKNKISELGCIVVPGTQRNSIAKEALATLASYLSKQLCIEEFTLDIHPENVAATRLAASLGYAKCPVRANIYSKQNTGD